MHLKLSILFRNTIGDLSSGRHFFELIDEHYRELVPKKWNITEPINQTFSMDKLNESLSKWGHSYLWKSSYGESQGGIYLGASYKTHDTIRWRFAKSKVDADKLACMVYAIISHFDVIYASCYSHYNQDLSDVAKYKKYLMPMEKGVSTFTLREGIPSLNWLTYLGAELAELVDTDELSSVDLSKLETVRNGIFIQLFDNFKTPYDEFVAKRNEVQSALNGGIFLDRLAANYPSFVVS